MKHARLYRVHRAIGDRCNLLVRETEVEDEFHGEAGPLTVSPPGVASPLYDLFAEAAERAGFPRSADYNGAEPVGVARPDMTIGRGRRLLPPSPLPQS